MNKLMSPQGARTSRTCTVRNFAFFSLILSLLLGCNPGEGGSTPSQEPTPETQALTSDVQKASYGMGYNLSRNLKQQTGGVLDPEAFVLGVEEALAGTAMRLTDEEISGAMQSLQKQRDVAANEQGEKNMAAGKAFLEKNGKREGVTTLESGLQYEILVEGSGPTPSATDSVTTHYEGTLIDGTVFDSSVARGEPAVFPVNRVIPGWVEALQLMPQGSKWRLYIPSNLAYGERGAGPSIGPNSTLIFDVELLKIN